MQYDIKVTIPDERNDMPSFADGTDPGLFLPTTIIVDVGYLQDIAQFTPDILRQILIRIVQGINDSNQVVNLKDSGMYPLTEFVTGQTFFPNPAIAFSTTEHQTQRNNFRKMLVFGPLANAGTTTIPHGITMDANTTMTNHWGEANDTTAMQYVKLPFVSVSGMVAAGNIELLVDNTNIYVTTTGNGTNFNICYVVLEYLKN